MRKRSKQKNGNIAHDIIYLTVENTSRCLSRWPFCLRRCRRVYICHEMSVHGISRVKRSHCTWYRSPVARVETWVGKGNGYNHAYAANVTPNQNAAISLQPKRTFRCVPLLASALYVKYQVVHIYKSKDSTKVFSDRPVRVEPVYQGLDKLSTRDKARPSNDYTVIVIRSMRSEMIVIGLQYACNRGIFAATVFQLLKDESSVQSSVLWRLGCKGKLGKSGAR